MKTKIKNKIIKNQKGFLLLEILMAISIFAIITIGIFNLSVDTVQNDSRNQVSSEALFYAQEGIEAVRNMRDRNYLDLTNGDHGLSFLADSWTFIAAPEDVDGFYNRTITIEDVYRDENGDIAAEGAYLDTETKKVTSEITWTWKGILPQSAELTTYISNWPGDDWVVTTCDEFDQGAYEDSELEITDPPPENNCSLKLTAEETSSEFYSSANVGTHGRDVVVDGDYAYLATNSSKNGLSIIDITDRENPYEVSDVNVGGKGRYLNKIEEYVYIGVQRFSTGLGIIDVSNPLDPDYQSAAWTIFGYGNEPEPDEDGYLFVATNSYIFGLMVYSTEFWGIPILIETKGMGSEVHVIELKDDYAYIGLDNDWEGFRILDISNPYNVTDEAKLDVGEEVNAVELSGAIAFLGTEDSNDSLQVINISDPTDPSIITSLDVGGEIEDLTITGDYLYAAINNQNAGLAVINISNPYSPYLVYNLDIGGKGEGIDSDENYVYVAMDTNNKGLVIIGITSFEIIASGTFTSSIYDTQSSDTRYNFVEWDHTDVPGGSVKLQMRTSATAEGLNYASWVGPDGTVATYYENPRTQITLDPSRDGQRYCQFKVYIDSDGASTPLIESVKINYTP